MPTKDLGLKLLQVVHMVVVVLIILMDLFGQQ